MSLFKSQKHILGVDLGVSSIKVVELAQANKGAELVTYGFAKFRADDIKKDSALEQEKIAAILKKICKEAKVSAVNAIASLPPFFVFTSIINLPQMLSQDIEAAVKWEAKKVIPLPLDQIELKWKAININQCQGKDSEKNENNQKEKQGKKMQILLTGAAKKIVQRYMNIFKTAGLNLYSLETESFALSRSLLNEKENSVAMVVDIGALNTNIAIIKSGIPFLNKSIDVGALTISKSIANSLNINIERAEQFQYDIGITINNKDQAIPKIIEESLAAIVNEIKYSFNLYEEYKGTILSPDDRIEKIVLCGGGVIIPNLAEYLSGLLNIKVYIGDPWDKVKYNEELKLILQEIGPNFPVAVWLAMRDLH
ncbi:MAG: type IV pilus assembly protein PilM [bacterium]